MTCMVFEVEPSDNEIATPKGVAEMLWSGILYSGNRKTPHVKVPAAGLGYADYGAGCSAESHVAASG